MTTELDIENPAMLTAYLRQAGHIGATETPDIRLLTGGVSNRTVLVKRENGDAWVVKQALAKLRVAVDWFSAPERVHREAAGLRALAPLLPAGTIPTLIFEDHTDHLLGMSAVAEPHVNWKVHLLAGEIALAHVRQFGQILGTIHREASAQQAQLAPQFQDRSFFESLRLEPYYAYTATQIPTATTFLAELIAATRQRQLTLVHGDYSPKNTLLYHERLVLLDYEVIHWGDPAFDLGFSLTHLLSKAHHLPMHRDQFIAAAHTYWQSYLAALGEVSWLPTLEAWAVRHTLACLLARVAGRSPLEYLTDAERRRQQETMLGLLLPPIESVEELIAEFIAGIEAG